MALHKRILLLLLQHDRFFDAFFYFDSLMDKFTGKLACDLGEDLEQPEHESPSCKLFRIHDGLYFDLQYILDLNTSDSDRGKEQRKTSINDFKKKVMSNVSRLNRIIKAEEYAESKRDQEHQKHLDLYDCALRAKDQGFNVETGVGTALEQGFEKAAELSGLTLKTLEARKRHEKLLKKTDKTKFEKKVAQLLLELENDLKHTKSASEKELIKKQIKRIKTMEVK